MSEPSQQAPNQSASSDREELAEWEVLRDGRADLLHASNRPAGVGWGRFGVRHVLLWMTAIALGTSATRLNSLFLGEDYGYPGAGIEEILIAMVGGTIVGLGLPIVFTGPEKTRFLEHPSRVLFALLMGMVGLGAIQRFTFNGNLVGVDGLAFEMGVSATAFVWALYASIRPSIGWLWRGAMILICLECLLDFILLLRLIGFSSMLGGRRYASYIAALQNLDLELTQLLTLPVVVAFTVFIAGLVEVLFGRFRDWRTWVAMTVIPLCLIVGLVPVGIQLWRSYQIDVQSRVID